jgi:hypothetical protein
MATSFSGISFFSGQEIEDFLVSNQPDFVDMVTSYSVILGQYQKNQNEVIRIAKHQAYPRIGLILSSAKTPTNEFLFGDPSSPGDLRALYDNVLNIMTNPDSPFSMGITGIAARYTAAILIAQIPMNTQEISNVDLSGKIEDEATKDLERLIKVYNSGDASFTVSTPASSVPTNAVIFIALGINKTTIPSTYFDVAPANEVLVFEDSYANERVRTLQTLTLPSEFVHYGWLYFSTLEKADTLKPYSVENTFTIRTGDNVSSIIDKLSICINEATLGLDAGSIIKANILAAPNRADAQLRSTVITKSKLYPAENNEFDYKRVACQLETNIGYVTFSSRRRDSVIATDLIILNFYSLSKVTLAQTQLSLSVLPTYEEEWVSQSYAANSIVDYNGVTYISIATTNTTPPSPLNNQWTIINTENTVLKNNRDKATIGIEGVVFGKYPDYRMLDEEGPLSTVVLVDKASVTADSSGGGSDPTAETSAFLANTFYFNTDSVINGTFSYRVSTNNTIRAEEYFQLVGNDGVVSIDFVNATAEELALEFLKSLYGISGYTDVLGALVHPKALQVVSFKTNIVETREIVDILEVPTGLSIATGTAMEIKTEYAAKPRSVVVDTRIVRGVTNANTNPDNTDGLKDSGKYQVKLVQIAQGRVPSAVQSIHDKLNTIFRREV